ncbi:MAG: PhnD/SsuA/transferrin family substrate-binding protein [Sneathiella sp.]
MINAHVSLPMYDWPELKNYTDAFHSLLQDSFGQRGFHAPHTLERTRPEREIWQDQHLLMSQTCGLPYVSFLKDEVSLIGTPAYDINCGAGSYFSVIVVHQSSDINTLEDLKGLKFAYNDSNSQSGYAALLHTLSDQENAAEHFTSHMQSGGHRQSVQAVAEGLADFAAIDAISWKLAMRHEKTAARLRVIATTAPTPGLPYITCRRPDIETDKLHMAVIDAMMTLDETTRDALLLTGLSKTRPNDYHVIEKRLRRVQEKFGPMI